VLEADIDEEEVPEADTVTDGVGDREGEAIGDLEAAESPQSI